MHALQALIRHPERIKAKQLQSRWLNGYQVVVAQVLATYGDNGIQHPLANRKVTTNGQDSGTTARSA
jgi:hypothetical protein